MQEPNCDDFSRFELRFSDIPKSGDDILLQRGSGFGLGCDVVLQLPLELYLGAQTCFRLYYGQLSCLREYSTIIPNNVFHSGKCRLAAVRCLGI